MKREVGSRAPGSVKDLIERARLGDNDSLEELFRRCRPWIDELAARHLAKKQPGILRPSDVAQETALRAFKRFSTFKGTTEAEWLLWLKRIVDTTVTQSFRDAGRKKRKADGTLPLDSSEATEVPTSERSPSQAAAIEEEWQKTFAQMFQLPEEHRRALWLCHLKELPVAEVAARMGKTQAAVAGLLQRGLRALRLRMTEGTAGAPAGARLPAASEDAALALLAYLRRRDAGEHVDPDTFVAEHPSCADELRDMLEWIAHFHAIRPSQVED